MVKAKHGKYLQSTEDLNILIKWPWKSSQRRWYLTKDIKKIQTKPYLLPCSVVTKRLLHLKLNEKMTRRRKEVHRAIGEFIQCSIYKTLVQNLAFTVSEMRINWRVLHKSGS